MKVKFKNKVNKESAIEKRHEGIEDYIAIGEVFYVYGIRFFNNYTYVYIYDESHLIELPLSFFEIEDQRISNNWIFKIWETGEITIWPELFYQLDFFENFSERETKERKQFEAMRKIELI